MVPILDIPVVSFITNTSIGYERPSDLLLQRITTDNFYFPMALKDDKLASVWHVLRSILYGAVLVCPADIHMHRHFVAVLKCICLESFCTLRPHVYTA